MLLLPTSRISMPGTVQRFTSNALQRACVNNQAVCSFNNAVWVGRDEFGLSLGAWMIQGDPSFFLSLLPRLQEKIGGIAEAGGERLHSSDANDSEKNKNDAKKRVLYRNSGQGARPQR